MRGGRYCVCIAGDAYEKLPHERIPREEYALRPALEIPRRRASERRPNGIVMFEVIIRRGAGGLRTVLPREALRVGAGIFGPFEGAGEVEVSSQGRLRVGVCRVRQLIVWTAAAAVCCVRQRCCLASCGVSFGGRMHHNYRQDRGRRLGRRRL